MTKFRAKLKLIQQKYFYIESYRKEEIFDSLSGIFWFEPSPEQY